MYWVSRSQEVNEQVQRLLESQKGRIIIRPSSDAFFLDLISTIDSYKTHESGFTPEAVKNTTISALRKKR